jgi:peroxiredoxin
MEPDLRKRDVQLVLVSYGDAGANRRLAEENGLDCPILIQEQGKPIEAFLTFGTPVAYLVDERGQVARPLAFGAEQVPLLAREAAGGKRLLPGQRPLSESRIERSGLKPGTRAPSFTLKDVRGRTVSLAQFRGRRVLLVFTDPDCGPCDALMPDLARLHQQHRNDGLSLVLVGRGEIEANRRKAKEHGISFPVVIQDRWKLSKDYGIFATPVAFLIDAEGIIERDVAQGAEQILMLAREGLARGKGGRDERSRV